MKGYEMNFLSICNGVFLFFILTPGSMAAVSSTDYDQEQTCPYDIIPTTSGCYAAYYNRMRWSDARNYCNRKEKGFAKPQNQHVSDAIKEYLNSTNGCQIGSFYTYWIGVQRTKGMHEFHFEDSQDKVPFTDWVPWLDTTTDDIELSCVAYQCENGQYYWKLQKCGQRLSFLCERKECPPGCIIQTTTTTTTTATPVIATPIPTTEVIATTVTEPLKHTDIRSTTTVSNTRIDLGSSAPPTDAPVVVLTVMLTVSLIKVGL